MIVVTGANGFIGSAIVWELNREKIPVLACVDRVSLADRPLLLARRRFEIFLLKDQLWNFLDLPSTLEKCSWVLHMGANSSTTETNAEHLRENNTLYTQRIFEWCTNHGKNFIYASSAATYGAGELGYDDTLDSERLKPLNLYGESKVRFDRWAVRQVSAPPHWYGLRFFNVYGPNEDHKGDMASVAFKAFHQIRERGWLELFKSHSVSYRDGEQMRDFVYVKDVTSWIIELMEKKPASGIYNMGSGQARPWKNLANAVFRASQQPADIRFIDMPPSIRGQYQYFTEAKMQKWHMAGLSTPRWPLEAGIRDYIENYLLKPEPHL